MLRLGDSSRHHSRHAGLDLGVEIGLHVLCVDFDNQGEPHGRQPSLQLFLIFPPASDRMHRKDIPAGKIGCAAGDLIDVQGSDIAPITPESPQVVLLGLRERRLFIRSAVASVRLHIGAVRLARSAAPSVFRRATSARCSSSVDARPERGRTRAARSTLAVVPTCSRALTERLWAAAVSLYACVTRRRRSAPAIAAPQSGPVDLGAGHGDAGGSHCHRVRAAGKSRLWLLTTEGRYSRPCTRVGFRDSSGVPAEVQSIGNCEALT